MVSSTATGVAELGKIVPSIWRKASLMRSGLAAGLTRLVDGDSDRIELDDIEEIDGRMHVEGDRKLVLVVGFLGVCDVFAAVDGEHGDGDDAVVEAQETVVEAGEQRVALDLSLEIIDILVDVRETELVGQPLDE